MLKEQLYYVCENSKKFFKFFESLKKFFFEVEMLLKDVKNRDKHWMKEQAIRDMI